MRLSALHATIPVYATSLSTPKQEKSLTALSGALSAPIFLSRPTTPVVLRDRFRGITSGLLVAHQQPEIWNPSPHSIGCTSNLGIVENKVLRFWDRCTLGPLYVAGTMLCGCHPKQELSNVRNRLGSSVSWLCFENPDVPHHKSIAPDRAHPGQNESRCLKKCSPLTLATLSTAGNSKHVEIAHQAAFQLRI